MTDFRYTDRLTTLQSMNSLLSDTLSNLKLIYEIVQDKEVIENLGDIAAMHELQQCIFYILDESNATKDHLMTIMAVEGHPIQLDMTEKMQ